MNRTKIEWTDATWNPVTGCTPVSAGCENCYARRMANRLRGRAGYPADEPFRVTLHPDKLDDPLHWRKPRRVFVCSMGDLFHEDVPFGFVDKAFVTTAMCPQHRFQLLTKRPARMLEYLDQRAGILNAAGLMAESLRLGAWPQPNLWLGVSVENQQAAEERIEVLLNTPAAVRFVSVEPMLGPVDVSPYLSMGMACPQCRRWECQDGFDVLGATEGNVFCNHCGTEVPAKFAGGLDWVICGGESGPGARPMHPQWVRDLRDQCDAAGVPFFFKQWGEWLPTSLQDWEPHHKAVVGDTVMWRHGYVSRKYGLGVHRLLDGREWNEYPKTGDDHETVDHKVSG